MDIATLKAELVAGHPDTGAYNVDDEIAAGQLNAVNRTTNRSSMTGSEILNEIVKADFNLLAADDQKRVWDIVHLGVVNPFGIEADMMVDIFGGSSATIIALQAARKNNVSRAVELGLGRIGPGNVTEAKEKA